MNLQVWGLYASAVVFLCLTPGPNSLLAVTNGARFGVAKAIYSTLGCAVGLTTLIGVSLSGLGLILAASEVVFHVIKWLGAGYLMYLGVTLLSSRATFADAVPGVSCTRQSTNLYLFVQGLWIVAMNPKVLIFFTAFLPQFYVAGEGFWMQYLAMACTFVAIAVTVEVVLASFANRIAAYAGSGGRLRLFNRATGGVFVLAGAYLLAMDRPR